MFLYLFGLQHMPRPLFAPDEPGGSGGTPPAPPAGDPPTLTPPPDPATPSPPASATTPATRTRKPRAPKPPAAPPETVVTVSPKVENVVDKLEGLPTPGGLVLLLVIIAIFLFAIVPVSGKRTRLRLLWDTVRGTTSLPDPTQANASSSSNSISHNILPGGIDNTPIGIAPTLQSTGTGSPISPAMTAASSGMSATVSGYDDNSSAYPDMFEASSYPQGYPGETEYMVPDFPEY